MSCQTGAATVAQSAGKNGISRPASKTAYTAGASTVARGTLRKKSQAAVDEKLSDRTAPTQRQIKVKGAFSDKQLERLYIQISLGEAGTRRHVQMTGRGYKRGRLHQDPRPLDWARLDLAQYEFLTEQLRAARRSEGYIDTGGLSKTELSDLWQFLNFETDRAHRQIDHLNIPGWPVGPPASNYLIGKHKLEARFYSYLASQIERQMPARELWAARQSSPAGKSAARPRNDAGASGRKKS